MALKLIPFTFSLIALGMVYVFVRAARGERAAWFATLFYGTAVSLLKWNFDARGGYAECQVLIPLTLYLLGSRALSPASRTRDAALVGLFSGFGVYLLQMFVPVGLTCALLLSLRRGAAERVRSLAAFGLGAVAGMAPVLLHGSPGGAVGLDPRPLLARLVSLPQALFLTLTRFLPGLFSYDNLEGYPPFRLFPNGLEYVFLLAALAVLVSRRGRSLGFPPSETAPVPIEGILFLYVGIYLVLFSLHPLAANSPRYLLFLEPPLSILAGLGAAEALAWSGRRSVRGVAVILVSLVLGDRAVQMTRLAGDDRIYGPDGPSDPRTAEAVMAFLDENGIRRLVTEDWDLGWRIAFKSRERIIALHNLNNLHQAPPFAAVVAEGSEDDHRVFALLEKRGQPVARYVLSGKAIYTVGLEPSVARDPHPAARPGGHS
ncbi:MAG TPA: hypothetical protein VN083_07610, partial [Vicinamibacteria bacterium]|nr:hypothetical protein [Vicinamibacteria bacterium]